MAAINSTGVRPSSTASIVHLAILALIIIIIVAIIRKPNVITLMSGAFIAILWLAVMARRQSRDGFDPATEPPDISMSEKHNDYSASPCEEHRAEPAPLPESKTDAVNALISKSNRFSLDQIYGRRYMGTIDNALYAHKQRIGDRDRQATIAQVRARRNNVYEPYFRQELSEENSVRWWEPDDVLNTLFDKRQLDTIDMGRSAVWNADIDGIYPPL